MLVLTCFTFFSRRKLAHYIRNIIFTSPKQKEEKRIVLPGIQTPHQTTKKAHQTCPMRCETNTQVQ
jgi:hypothetical protein